MEDRTVCIRVESVYGGCKGFQTSSRIDFNVRGKGLITLLKPSKDKGAALLHVVTKLRAPGDNSVCVSKRHIGSIPTTGQNVNFMFRGCTLFHCVAICSGMTFNLRLTGIPGGRVGGHIARLLRLAKLDKVRGHCPGRLSNKRHRQITFTHTLTPGPRMLLLSRPFTTVSTGIHARLHG